MSCNSYMHSTKTWNMVSWPIFAAWHYMALLLLMPLKNRLTRIQFYWQSVKHQPHWYRHTSRIISIYHGCMVWIEKSFTRVTDRHHEACRVMPNSDPEWQIFLSTPNTHDRYFFLHTSRFTTFDFQRRTCYKVILFPLKSFYSSLKKSTLPATAVRFFTLTSNLHKVTSFFDVTL